MKQANGFVQALKRKVIYSRPPAGRGSSTGTDAMGREELIEDGGHGAFRI